MALADSCREFRDECLFCSTEDFLDWIHTEFDKGSCPGSRYMEVAS